MIRSVATALPPHVLTQDRVRDFAYQLYGEEFPSIERLISVYDNAQIEKRNFCVPLEWFGEKHTFREKNDLYVENAIGLSTEAIAGVLEQSNLTHADIDALIFVSTTGLATPSIDAHLINALPFRQDIRRLPIWGLGCAGGVSGLSRAREMVVADPTARVLVVVVELCGLTFMPDDLSKPNLIATALFGDGCAAVLVEGEEAAGDAPGLRMLGSLTRSLPDALDVMGWDISGDGFGIVISRDIPTIVRTFMRESIEIITARHNMTPADLKHLIAHPGGAKVLEAYQDSLNRPPKDFHHTWEVLRNHGNMSAASVLFVLERFMGEIREGESGLLGALGPGFSSETMIVLGHR